MPGMSIPKMKEGYSQIRNKALARVFGYMNMIEGWGTGIPKLLREMKECGLPEPEFIDMEGALRINLYRVKALVEKLTKKAKLVGNLKKDQKMRLYMKPHIMERMTEHMIEHMIERMIEHMIEHMKKHMMAIMKLRYSV